MTHKELVEIAYKWVLKNGKMTVAFKELYSLAREIPDVIGFNSWQSAVIECKVSRADFLGDMKKKHREKGMGNWRYYCCPAGMIRPEELPTKWGLIYVTDGKAKVVVNCRGDQNCFQADTLEERRLMFTVIRRLFIKGYVKHIYDKQYNRNSVMNDLILLNSEQNPEVCDATEADSKENAG